MIEKFNFYELHNNGRIRIFGLKFLKAENKQAEFTIKHCNLGKGEFFDIDLRHADTILLNSSHLIECTFNNITWPKSLYIPEKDMDSTYFSGIKEAYRQLKYAYSKQGDTVLEHKFHGLEMEAYPKQLKHDRKEAVHVHKSIRWLVKGQNSLTLWFSWWTSNYGQNFVWSLLTLAAFNIVLFTFLALADGVPGLRFVPDFSYDQIVTTVGEALKFANPLRKYDTDATGWSVLIYLVMRIVSSYCLYNVIRATRRFVK
ncbi:hypothetical protein GO495_06525 [Chitinophaga oryziterrae]|uniref:Uncharacterized protein n=1 Tax=Chitinophaga oryziterrae TaxID=1031224 RepID=A0A6N8J7N9_9BACT|nr:hypothetical protein [Chitinophaga oryziterrae]MVT40229.1 hypothetical protein [Chitinophaga oryziterrae]